MKSVQVFIGGGSVIIGTKRMVFRLKFTQLRALEMTKREKLGSFLQFSEGVVKRNMH